MYSPYRWAKSEEDLESVRDGDVDWEGFLMGKPDRPFDPKIYRSFRLFRDFSSGIIDQWMSHGIDVVHMLTGELYPTSLVAHGGLYRYHDYRENPDTVQVALEYGHGNRNFPRASRSASARRRAGPRMCWAPWEHSRSRTRGESPGTAASIPTPSPRSTRFRKSLELHHMANWLDAIRRRDPGAVYAPVEAGYGHSIAGIMATDSLWSGRRKAFNPDTRGDQRRLAVTSFP